MDQKTLEARPVLDGRILITREEWKKVHRDFRGGSTRDDTASAMCMWDGITTLVQVRVVTQKQLDKAIALGYAGHAPKVSP